MDIDIDFPDRQIALSVFNHIVAIREPGIPHNTGVYVTSIPNDIRNNLATIRYKEAEERGYFKIDFLNVNIYKHVKSEEHLIQLMNAPVIWELFLMEEITEQLFHVNGHHDLLVLMKPTSIEQLAAVLAMIRPAKRYLIGKDWDTIFKEVWIQNNDQGYAFRKSHSVSYAVAITVQLNALCEQMMDELVE